ncbi:MAG TPA: uracil-DNA glycosylase family protein [Cyclobacteriaceae bacterium]|nr:uracil-DNA glycosylase family protein [Cyclobacteriaceae bacterium]
MTLADQILSFQRKLRIKVQLPKGVDVMNPYRDKLSMAFCEQFYRKFYSDDKGRTMILGINPGRFGGGITGIPFTDPVKLEALGINNELAKKRELSADFIYAMIDSCGGPEKFYSQFYFGAVSPLGFVREDKNLNYYDIKGLPALLETFIVKCLKEQMAMGMHQKICFCLGEGENFKFIQHLNKRYRFFENIVALPHPRFIMQYRRKRLTEFIELYKARLFA